MPESSPLYIVDTNIFIDLSIGDLLVDFFHLPHRFASPDVIIAELRDPKGSCLTELGLQTLHLDGPQVEDVITLRARHKALSIPDLFALVASRHHNAILLTGDSGLRQMAEEQGVPVHGTLWVLDELVRLEVIECTKAASALNKIMEAGSFLPDRACQARLKRWR
jgi:predicted nucleic acid-binding protein